MSDENIYQTVSEALKAIPGFVKIETAWGRYDLCFELYPEKPGEKLLSVIYPMESIGNIENDIDKIAALVERTRAEAAEKRQ